MKPGEEGCDLLPIMNFNGTALWLGDLILEDLIGVSCKFRRARVALLSLAIRSSSGVPGRLSGSLGKFSKGSTLGDAGSLGGSGSKSPY